MATCRREERATELTDRYGVETTLSNPDACAWADTLAVRDRTDLTAFQKSVSGLDPTGEFDTQTYAAMIGALRALGARSPIPVAR